MSVRGRLLLMVLLVNQSTSCRYLPPAPGQAKARDARKFCHLLEKAHKAGLSNQSLYIDVGVDYGMEVLIAHAYGHPVVAFECRLQGASEFINKPFWTPNGKIPLPSSVRLVPGCASDRNGLGTLSHALDSSTVHGELLTGTAGQQIGWKSTRDGGMSTMINGSTSSFVITPKVTTMPFLTLDTALDRPSLAALGLGASLSHHGIGLLKIDAQGHDAAILRGAVRTLLDYLPLVIYEDEMLPEEQRRGRFLSVLLGDSGARSNYTCGCDATDCVCAPLHSRPELSNLVHSAHAK